MTTKDHSFCVDDNPYCVWDTGLRDINADFLKSMDPKFYNFIADNYKIISNIETDKKNKQFASILLRNYYTHALETLFALIFAALQYPECVLIWLLKYQNTDLYNLVEKVHKRRSIKIRFEIKEKFYWDTIVKIIFDRLPDNIDKSELIEVYTDFLNSFATDFLDQNLKNEYNSVKHGFRVQPGGFSLLIKPQVKKGESESNKSWFNLNHSEYGSLFYTQEKIPGLKNHTSLKYQALNWNPENISNRLCFISLFLHNILTFLKLINHLEIEGTHYITDLPKDYSTFSWSGISGVGSFSMTPKEWEIETDEEKLHEFILSKYFDTITEIK